MDNETRSIQQSPDFTLLSQLHAACERNHVLWKTGFDGSAKRCKWMFEMYCVSGVASFDIKLVVDSFDQGARLCLEHLARVGLAEGAR